MLFETTTAVVKVHCPITKPAELEVLASFVTMFDTMDNSEWEDFKQYSANKLAKEWALYWRPDFPAIGAEIEYSYDDYSVTVEQIWCE